MIKKLKRWWAHSKAHPSALAIIAIVLLAIFFRFWQLWDLPPGLHPDEAANGLDIFRIQDGDIRAVYNTNGPRESLFFFIQAGFVWLFGNTILALRLAPALLGSLTVWITYLWANQWFSKRAALFASLFTATGSWAVTMSRNGYRASMLPLMIALTAWLTTKAIKNRKWYWYLLTGLSYGAGFYTYLSWRLTPLIVALLLGVGLVKYRKKWKEFIKPVLIFGLTTVIVLLPLLFHTYKHPEDIVGRSSVSFTNPELNQGKPLQTLGQTIIKTALMFNWEGDPNYRHNLGGEPMLNGLVGTLFLLGGLLSLLKFKDMRYLSLLAIFAVMLVPEILTAEGIPHGLRAIGAVPVVYLFAAIGLSELWARWKGVFPLNPIAHSAAVVIITSVLVVGVGYDYQRYFIAWANAPETYEAYSEDSVQASYYLNSHPVDGERLLVIDGYSNITVLYLTANKANYRQVDSGGLSSIDIGSIKQLIVMDSQVQGANAYLQPHLKSFKVLEVKSEDRVNKTLFTVYERK